MDRAAAAATAEEEIDTNSIELKKEEIEILFVGSSSTLSLSFSLTHSLSHSPARKPLA